jgi:hypothetical protein
MVGLMMTTQINQLLARDDLTAYGNAKQAVSTATSVREAVERAGILNGFTPAQAAEARAVLTALPRSVDAAILAALRSAFDRDAPGLFEWHEGAFIELRTWEEPVTGKEPGPWRLRIVLVSPQGQQFVRARR